MEKVLVLIVGAGPSGLAIAPCLSQLSIPYCIVEREDCSASLWRKRTYDRLKLHLAKEYCELPHMSYPCDTPTYVPKDQFVRYVDAYVDHFNIFPKYSTSVESCKYDEDHNCWDVMAHDQVKDLVFEYRARFLVVATGENSEGVIPEITGLHSFDGQVIHSSSFKSWNDYAGKRVLVVGCGNSGMEIAYDLANNGVDTSMVIRSPVHVMTKDMELSGPVWGHFFSRQRLSAVIDVGTTELIKKGIIKVLGPISCIQGNSVEFEDRKERNFNSLVFATGYKSTANMWLKNGVSLLNDNGMPKRAFPNHWKGDNGLYCVGLAMRGLAGISHDTKKVAADIKSIVDSMGPF
ncbi:hypothetical protein U9M48_035252 [Paspalum notatum var. saurae]|uniref:indole-3-pyruvate monooxygenase n=1 Tax=Paspalum notatum var. saurae TaxID=547442 RepID=A0AAQ3UEM4_PASNO